MICHSCGEDNAVASRFCAACGDPLGKTCPTCSFENSADSRFCGGCGKILQEAQSEDALGERRQITCLFVDLVGSTELSQQLDPEDLRDLLAGYQTVCNDAVEVHDGHIAHFLGDGVVIYFGYPRSHEDDPQRAVRCGLDIIDGVEALREGVDAADGLRLRSGAHIGRVLVGPVGAGDRRDRIALGDTPNIAARLEGEAEVGTLAVSDSLWELVRGYFTGRDGGLRSLKGVQEPMRVWIVEERTASVDRVDVAPTLSPLVGRDLEMERLLSIRDAALETGAARFALIRGDSGVGKSRMMRALREDAEAKGLRMLAMRSTPATANVPFEPVRAAIGAHLEIGTASDPLAAIDTALTAAGLGSDVHRRQLADFLGVAASTDADRPVVSAARQRVGTIALLVDLLIAWADDTPLLVLAEDVHWADASTIEVIDRLITQAPTVPLMLAMAARPSLLTPWLNDPIVDVVELSRLDAEAIGSLVDIVAGGKALPRSIKNEIAERSDGIPLFVEELTRTVLDSGFLVERSATWEAIGEIEHSFIPASVDAPLTARIDSLGSARATAQRAAVIGREFDRGLLARIGSRPAHVVDADIKAMVQAGLATISEDDPDLIVFKHALIRDAAYNSLLRTSRRTYHREVAAALAEGTSKVGPDALAFHLQEAGDYAAAIDYWLAASQNDLGTNSLFEAARHLTLAIDCIRELDESPELKARELEIQIQIWPLWAATEGWGSPRVQEACERGLALAAELERHDLLYGPLWGLWTVFFLRGEMDPALETARQVHEMAVATGVPLLRVTGEHALAYTHMYRGEFDLALQAAEQGLALYDLEQDREIANMFQLGSSVALRAVRAASLWMHGRIDEALAEWNELEQLSRELNHPPSLAAGLAFSLHGGSCRLAANDRLADLKPIIDELLEVTVEEGSLLWLAVARCYEGAAMASFEEADRAMLEAWEMFAQTGTRLTEVLMRVIFAEVRLRGGDLDGAERDLADAEAAHTNRHEGLMAPEIWRLRGRLLTARGDLDGARAAYDAALALADSQGAVMLRLRCLNDLIEIATSDRPQLDEEIGELLARVTADGEVDEIRRAAEIVGAT